MSNATTTAYPYVGNVTTVISTATSSSLGYGGILLKFGSTERAAFFNYFLFFGIPFMLLTFSSWLILWKKLQFRFDRVDAWIVISGICSKCTEKKSPGEDLKKVGCRIWWITKLIQLFLLSPLLLLLIWGVVTFNGIPNAPMMGIGMLTLWVGWILKLYAFCLWKANGWSLYIRNSKLLLKSLFGVSLSLLLLFEFVAVLVEETLDFTGVSWAFMTLNLLPLIVLVHSNEPDVAMTRKLWKQRGRVDSTSDGKHSSTNTENPMPDARKNGNNPNKEEKTYDVDAEENNHVELKIPIINFQSQVSANKNAMLYIFSVLILLCYIGTFAAGGSNRVKEGVITVSVAVSCAILLLDFILYLLWKGNYVTRPHIMFIIMLLCRAGLISFGFRYWFIGQSTMFFIFGVVIAKVIIDARMDKSLDAKEEADAEAAEKASKDDSEAAETTEQDLDKNISIAGDVELSKFGSAVNKISSNPVLIFAILVFAFMLLLVVVIIRSIDMLDINILGKNHKQSEFGFGSLYGTAVFLFFYWTGRSARTDALLQDSKEYFYFGRQTMLITIIFYVVTVTGGVTLFILTINDGTSTPHILFTAIFFPLIILSLMFWYTRWRAKDFNILSRRSLWKHEADTEVIEEGNPSTLIDGEEKNGRDNDDEDNGSDGNNQPKQLTEKDGALYWDTVYKVSICDTKGYSTGAPLCVKRGKCCCDLVNFYQNWSKGEFRGTNAFVAFIRGGLPHGDYVMFGLVGTFLLSTIFWGLGIQLMETSSNLWVKGMGSAIIFITLLVTATIIPIVEWFNRLQVSTFMTFMGVFCFAMHLSFHLYIFNVIQEGEVDLNSAGTLFSLFMYPTIVLICIALYKLRDDNWEMGKFVIICGITSQVILVVFNVCVIVLFGETVIGVILLIAQGLFLFLVGTIFTWIKNNYYLPKIHKILLVTVLCTIIAGGFLAGLAGSGTNAFVAFSASWFTICGLALGASVVSLYPAYLKGRLLFSETIFPVFIWDPDTTNVKVEYFGIFNAFLCLYVVFIWGVVATIFISPVYVGMGFASVALVSMFCLTLSLEYLSRRVFSQAIVNIKRQDEFQRMMTGKQRDSLKLVLEESEKKALKHHEGLAGKDGTVIQREATMQNLEGAVIGGTGGPSIVRTESVVFQTERMKQSWDSSTAPSADDYRDDISDIENKINEFYGNKFECKCDQKAMHGTNAETGSVNIEMAANNSGNNGEEKTNDEDGWGTGNTNASNQVVELKPVLRQLIDTDHALRSTEFQDQKLSVLYRAFVQLNANSQLLQAEADFSGFLAWCRKKAVQEVLGKFSLVKYFGREAQKKASIARQTLTLKEVLSWATTEPEAFKNFKLLTLTFQKAQAKLAAERKRKEAEERKAEERRKELMKKAEEERIRKEAEEWRRRNQEQARKDEEERKRKEEEARKRLEEQRRREEEEERRRQEAEDLELERLERERKKRLEEEQLQKAEEERRREEQERKDEEERKRNEESNRDEEERQRKRKELEARRKKRDAERKRRKEEEERKRRDEQNNNNDAIDPREAKRREIQRRRAERKKKLQEKRKKDARKLKEENERNRMAMLARQAAQGTGGDLTEEQLLEKDFKKDGDGKYIDRKFEDPKIACRINPNVQAADRIEKQGMLWVRPGKFMQEPQLVVVDEGDQNEGFGYGDIKQGELGDCWLLAAMTVLACHPEYMDKVLDIQGNKERAKKGYFRINIYRGGKMVPVLVDDRILCRKSNNRRKPFRPIFAKSRDENELWPLILEKAYARFHGSFEAINGGFVHVGLVDFTGGFGSSISLGDNAVDINSGALFKRLMNYNKKGFLMGAGSPSGSDADISEAGIVQGHAYAILNVKQESDANGNHQLVQLRNPWGCTEWKGDWSDDDQTHWTSRMKQRLGYTNADDGCFWMSFQDFCQNYAKIYLCQTFRLVNDGGQFYSAIGEASWEVAKKVNGNTINTAGGYPARKHKNSSNNPSFLIKVSRPCTLYISVQQRSLTGPMATEEHQSVLLLKKMGKRVGGIYRGDKIATSGQYINSEMITVEAHVNEYEPGYTLYCSTYEENCEARLTVRVYSDAPLKNVEYADGKGLLELMGQDIPVDDGRR